MCCVCECYKGSIVVMDVILQLVNDATSEAVKYLFKAANVCVVFCYCLLWHTML